MSKPEREIVAVRLQNATLDEKGNDLIVAHGWLDLAALLELRVGDYQREILEVSQNKKKSKIYTAIENDERLPDIMLGMRGQRFTTRGSMFYLEDDVYIIDGLQRVSNLRKFAVQYPDRVASIRIGAEVRFNTTRDSEKELFTNLNLNRTSMSPNVILRNAREESKGLLTLYGLSHNDPSFALYGRVCWNQKMSRNELLTAMIYCKTAITLHRAHGAVAPTSVAQVPGVLERIGEEIGIQHLRDNTYRFFETMDEIWGIKGLKYVEITTHLRANFLAVMARMFATHENFWDGKRLVVDAKQRQRLKSFSLEEPNVQRLASAGSQAADLLHRLLVDHMNKGATTNRLVPREIIERHKGAGAQRGHKARIEALKKKGIAGNGRTKIAKGATA